MAGQGTTDESRKRAVPYFFRWFNPEDYPHEDANPFEEQVREDDDEDA